MVREMQTSLRPTRLTTTNCDRMHMNTNRPETRVDISTTVLTRDAAGGDVWSSAIAIMEGQEKKR